MTITQSRMMFAGVIVLLVLRIASAQSPSNAQLSPADLAKAAIRSELNASDVSKGQGLDCLCRNRSGTACHSAK